MYIEWTSNCRTKEKKMYYFSVVFTELTQSLSLVSASGTGAGSRRRHSTGITVSFNNNDTSIGNKEYNINNKQKSGNDLMS